MPFQGAGETKEDAITDMKTDLFTHSMAPFQAGEPTIPIIGTLNSVSVFCTNSTFILPTLTISQPPALSDWCSFASKNSGEVWPNDQQMFIFRLLFHLRKFLPRAALKTG